MNNVLIYMYRRRLAPTGGPTGYNYNLCCQLERLGVKNVHFLETDKGDVSVIVNKIRSIKPIWLRNFLIISKSIYRKIRYFYGKSHKAVVDLNQYDVVHFQSTRDMFDCRSDLEQYRGKVVLTSHSPTLHSNEMYELLSPFEKKHMKWLHKKFITIDEYAFHRADYIVFPCKEAEEPYYHSWPEFSNFRVRNASRFRYLLSGIVGCQAKLTKETVRKKYGIPPDAFVISYVGRHNEIKGYDILKIVGEKLLQDENVYFLVAGKEDPIPALNNDRWIEVGWTNDPHSLIAASDMFMLPNRETYFDLVMLEVLSLGSIVVASNTGGNKYFSNFKNSGIILYDSIDEAILRIRSVQEMSQEERDKLKLLNKEIFEKNFTSEIFAKNYVSLVNSL